MNQLEKFSEHLVRKVAQQTSRRGFLSKLGVLVIGTSAIPRLPVARAAGNAGQAPDKTEEASSDKPRVAPQASIGPGEEGDPTSCDYWRYCAIAGALCACCGGSANACPPGSEMSPLSWIGTCRNPVDGKNYIISYNDCCGKPACSRCLCDGTVTNPDSRPVVRPQASAGYIWCLGTKETTYTCGTANVVGLAMDQE